MTSNRSGSSRLQAGFSLVEVLVTIAVIAIVSGIAITAISSVAGRSKEAAIARHAQMIASMATNALHGGDVSLTQAGSKEDALNLLSSGVMGEGSFSKVEFKVGLSQDEKDDVLPYLVYAGGLLVINPDAP